MIFLLPVCRRNRDSIAPELTPRSPLGKTETVSVIHRRDNRRSSPVARSFAKLRYAEKRSSSPSTARKPRADARRNRERILEVARLAFTRRGAEATLDDIARQAAIGPGTLYRHFPTRDALIEAVYRGEVEKLTTAGERFALTMPPLEALRAWMLLFIDHVASKKLILPAMETVTGGSMRLIEGARGPIYGGFLALIHRAIDSGDLRQDTDPNDLVRALVGVFHTTSMPGWEPSARRIVDILIAGSRTE